MKNQAQKASPGKALFPETPSGRRSFGIGLDQVTRFRCTRRREQDGIPGGRKTCISRGGTGGQHDLPGDVGAL